MTERPDEPSSSFSDDEWARFQEDAARSVRHRGGEAPKEPSARAREVTARLAALDAQAAVQRPRRRLSPRRRRRGAGEPQAWRPEGWRAGPAGPDMRGGRRWRRLAGMVAAVAFVVVASLCAGSLAERQGWTDGAADAAPLPDESRAPTVAPPTVRPDRPTRAHPFNGSPARHWAAGADALTLPVAKAVGGVPAASVADGLRLTKDFLVAANLDRDVLNGGRPTTALALVDPLEKEYLADLRGGLSHPTSHEAPTDVFTRFDAAEVRLVGDVVKVRGRMSVEPGKRSEGVGIHADYTFVYRS